MSAVTTKSLSETSSTILRFAWLAPSPTRPRFAIGSLIVLRGLGSRAQRRVQQTTPLMHTLRWMRVPGDTIFFLGAVTFVAFVIGLKSEPSYRDAQ